jgi:hypothetical protein
VSAEPPPPPPPPPPVAAPPELGPLTPLPRSSGSGSGLFISYRRGETSGQARALYDRFVQRFGTGRVFMDVDSIAPGVDFVQKIEEALESSGAILVLIGHDWLHREGQPRIIDDPSDFIRLEVDTALRLNVPTIPILVERTPMPEPEELPEALRPLARRNALELENGRWESDFSRLLGAVEQLLERDKASSRERAAPPPEIKRSFPRRTVAGIAAGAAAVIAIVVALVLILSPHPGPTPPPVKPTPAPLTAANSVAAVPSDRMVAALAKNGFTASELPSGTSASAQQISTFRSAGLVAGVYAPLSGPAANLFVDYYVFDTPGDASHMFSTTVPVPQGYTKTGTFSVSGISDSTQCDTGHRAAATGQSEAWGSSCLTISSNVVSFSVATNNTSQPATTNALVTALAADTVTHLNRVAGAASKGKTAAPPGALTASALYDQILGRSFDAALLPVGLGAPTVTRADWTTSPTGTIATTWLRLTFTGPDAGDFVKYYIFDNSQNAQAWFSQGLSPPQSTKGNTIDASGFSQAAACNRFAIAATDTASAFGMSTCYAVYGNVVVEGTTTSTSNTNGADDASAVTLTRAGIMYLDELDGS